MTRREVVTSVVIGVVVWGWFFGGVVAASHDVAAPFVLWWVWALFLCIPKRRKEGR